MAVFENELLVARGAEAELFKSEYLGLPVLVKRRVPKSYRNPVLDSRIRSERTVAEARLLHNAKEFGVRVPAVLRIDKAKAEIAMEFVPGKRVKDVLTKKNFKKIPTSKITSCSMSIFTEILEEGWVHLIKMVGQGSLPI